MNRPIFGHYGGYRKMLSYRWTCLIYHATKVFCDRNYSYRNDPLGKSSGQMNGAARSARQNMIEASGRAATSKEQELKQLDVAKGSLYELAGDYEAYLIDHEQVAWSTHDERYRAVQSLNLDDFSSSDDLDHNFGIYTLAMRDRCKPWLENEDPIIAANALLITIRRACALIMGQMRKTAEDFQKEGGFRESLTRIRLEYRNQQTQAPLCPKCNRPMRRLTVQKGPRKGQFFWSCTAYPECTGSREWEEPQKKMDEGTDENQKNNEENR